MVTDDAMGKLNFTPSPAEKKDAEEKRINMENIGSSIVLGYVIYEESYNLRTKHAHARTHTHAHKHVNMYVCEYV